MNMIPKIANTASSSPKKSNHPLDKLTPNSDISIPKGLTVKKSPATNQPVNIPMNSIIPPRPCTACEPALIELIGWELATFLLPAFGGSPTQILPRSKGTRNPQKHRHQAQSLLHNADIEFLPWRDVLYIRQITCPGKCNRVMASKFVRHWCLVHVQERINSPPSYNIPRVN